MVITAIHLILQRPATEDEIASHEYLVGLFDGMTRSEREEKGIRKPSDLANEGFPGKYVIHFKTSPEPLYNEIIIQHGRLQIGVPGASDRLKEVVSSMLSRNVRREHRSYYVVGELETSRSKREIGFRTLIARTALSLRHMGH